VDAATRTRAAVRGAVTNPQEVNAFHPHGTVIAGLDPATPIRRAGPFRRVSAAVLP
jgi:hypothetical protein